MLALLHVPILLAGLGAHGATVPSKPAPAHAPIASACSAVTRADVQLVLGRSVGQPGETALPGGSSCDFAGGSGMVTVTIRRVEIPIDLQAEAAGLKALIEGSTVRTLDDAGGRGFYLLIPEAGAQLYMVKEDRFVLISILGFGEAEAVCGAARELAARAIGKAASGGARAN